LSFLHLHNICKLFILFYYIYRKLYHMPIK
jgi:hypothetical protein